MPFFITNTGDTAWSSASLSLAAGSGILLNWVTLPVDLTQGLETEQLVASKIRDEPPLYVYHLYGCTNNDLSSTLQYLAPSGESNPGSSSAKKKHIVSGKKRVYGMLLNLTVAPGAGASRIFTLTKNGTDTGITITYGAAESGNKRSTPQVLDLEDGDLIQLKCGVTGTPADAGLQWSIAMSHSDPTII